MIVYKCQLTENLLLEVKEDYHTPYSNRLIYFINIFEVQENSRQIKQQFVSVTTKVLHSVIMWLLHEHMPEDKEFVKENFVRLVHTNLDRVDAV